jgi:hypothetical protein
MRLSFGGGDAARTGMRSSPHAADDLDDRFSGYRSFV